jgi:polyisoprenoid-binding protein YceI
MNVALKRPAAGREDSMKARIAAAILLTFGTAGIAGAQAAPRISFSLQPESRIWVEGTSTVRSYSCDAEVMSATVQSSGSTLVRDRVAAEVASGSLSVVVDRLECGNTTMNGHLRRALKSDANPSIEFRMKRLATQGDKAWVTGDLTIAGQRREITLYGDLVQEAGGALRLRGTHDVNMTEFGVTPPRLMAGTLRVHENAKVGFDVLFR